MKNLIREITLKHLIAIICFISILLANKLVFSFYNNNSFNFYSVNDGLSQSTIYSIYQDKQGYIWLGTGDGLCRFNGYEFKVLKNNVEKYKNLPCNSIRALIEDDSGNLWIGTDKGICLLSKKLDRIFSFQKINQLSVNGWEIPIKYIEGNLYFWMSGKGILKYDLKVNSLTKISNSIFEKNYHIENFVTQKANIYYIPNQYKILCNLNVLNDSISYYSLQYAPDLNTKLFEYNDSILLYNSVSGLACFNVNKKTNCLFVPDLFNDDFDTIFRTNNLKNIVRFRANELIISISNKGLYFTDNNFRIISHINDEKLEIEQSQYSLNYITKIFNFNNNHIWLGTDGSGICKYSPHQMKFKKFNTQSSVFPYLKNPIVYAVFSKNDTVYVSSLNGGISVFDFKNKKQWQVFYPLTNKLSFTAITEFDDKNLLLCSNNGFYQYNKYSKKINFIKNSDNISCSNICKFEESKFVLGGSSGLFLLSKNSIFKLEVLNNKQVSALYKLDDNRLLVGLGFKAYVLKVENDEFNIVDSIVLPNSENSKIKIFSKYRDEFVLFGTDNGLFVFDNNFNFKFQFTTVNGLSDNLIYGIIVDKNDDIWLSTNKGISLISNFRIKNFDISDGLQSFEFNSGAFYYDEASFLFFGGINGLNYSNSFLTKENKEVPSLQLNKLFVNDNEFITNYSADYLRNLNLKHTENTLSFELTAIEYTNPSKNQYAFKLENFENEWYYNANKRFIRYSNLNPGKYVLYCKSSNNDGVWSQPKKIISIVINPPWWQTLIFKISSFVLLVLIIVLIVVLVLRFKYKKKIKEVERLAEIERIRLNISQDIHDDVGSKLTKIAILSNLIKNSNKEESKRLEKLNQLENYSKQAIKDLKDVVWSVSPEYDNISSLLAYMKSYLNTILDQTEIKYTFKVENQESNKSILPIIRSNISMCFKEAINNAVKHSKSDLIDVVVKFENPTLIIQIFDIGQGFDVNDKFEFHHGLKNMKKRMDNINGSFRIESNKSTGTLIELTCKL